MTFAQYDQVKAGTQKVICQCGSDADIQFAPGNLGFSFKDGESGGWASKALKENAYRAKRSRVMAQRERDHVFKPRLVPNFQGQETGTWKEAQLAASQSDKGDVAAITYEPLVKQEQVGT